MLTSEIISSLLKIAREAGAAILKVYSSEFDIHIKSDKSPVTEADYNANKVIMKGLKRLPVQFPILSEEGSQIEYAERKKWTHFWLVDPLDGTKEFIKKNGEFTVNIGLINNGVPVFGVVYAPVIDCIYWGGSAYGAFKMEKSGSEISISVKNNFDTPIILAGSRSHPGDKMKAFINQFEDTHIIPMGSSLKICSVAEGTVHLYPRLGPTMEWDTGAAHAILKAAGGEINKYGTNTPLEYNKQNLLNPEFIAGNKTSMNTINQMN